MTTIFVLPTADIVREYHHLDALFVFYDDGIKGIIRDALLLSQGVTNQYTREIELRRALEPFMDKVLRTYDNSTEAMLQRLLENTSAELYVEMVVADVWQRVSVMMKDLFQHLQYDVSRAEHRWLGNDLMTVVRLF